MRKINNYGIIGKRVIKKWNNWHVKHQKNVIYDTKKGDKRVKKF